MVAVNVEPFEIETRTRAGELVRADAYLHLFASSYRHDATHPSRLRLHERARAASTAQQGGRA